MDWTRFEHTAAIQKAKADAEHYKNEVRMHQAAIEELKAEIVEMTKERDHWRDKESEMHSCFNVAWSQRNALKALIGKLQSDAQMVVYARLGEDEDG